MEGDHLYACSHSILNGINNNDLPENRFNMPEVPPDRSHELWNKIASRLDRNEKIIDEDLLLSLWHAKHYHWTSQDARMFLDECMGNTISFILRLDGKKIDKIYRGMVNVLRKLLHLLLEITSDDLCVRADPGTGDSTAPDVLASFFDRKVTSRKYHIVVFHERFNGFSKLAMYISARVGTPQFPSLETIHSLLSAALDVIPLITEGGDRGRIGMTFEHLWLISEVVKTHLFIGKEEALSYRSTDALTNVCSLLEKTHSLLRDGHRLLQPGDNNPRALFEFHHFWRNLTLRFITSHSHSLKLLGWEQIRAIIESAHKWSPPAESYMLSGAGCAFINGRYDLCDEEAVENVFLSQRTAVYQKVIPDNAPDDEVRGALRGKKFILYKYPFLPKTGWFISELLADERKRPVRYYQYRSKACKWFRPPATGWGITQNGIYPPPMLEPIGFMGSAENWHDTVGHELAEWAIGNHIIELALGDSVREESICNLATLAELIIFLAGMADKCPTQNTHTKKKYCIGTYHLSLLCRDIKVAPHVLSFLQQHGGPTFFFEMMRSWRMPELFFNSSCSENPGPPFPVGGVPPLEVILHGNRRRHHPRARRSLVGSYYHRLRARRGGVPLRPLSLLGSGALSLAGSLPRKNNWQLKGWSDVFGAVASYSIRIVLLVLETELLLSVMVYTIDRI